MSAMACPTWSEGHDKPQWIEYARKPERGDMIKWFGGEHIVVRTEDSLAFGELPITHVYIARLERDEHGRPKIVGP